MAGMTKSSLGVSIMVLLIAASCARVPQEDQGPPSGESQSTEGNSPAIVQPAASPDPTTESSTPNDVSSAVETDNHQQSADEPPAKRFDTIGTEIDLNSGDLRWTRHVLDRPPRYEIYETALSREVRRLSIPIPKGRQWIISYGPPSGRMEIFYVYQDLLRDVHRLLQLLDEVKASDRPADADDEPADREGPCRN